MAKAFNLTAQINLQGPANLKPVVAQIKKEFASVNTNLKLGIDPKASKSVDSITAKLKSMNAVLASAKQNTDSLNASLSLLSSSLSTISSTTSKTSSAVNKLSSNASSAGATIAKASTAMEEFGKQSALAVKRFAAFSVPTAAIFGLINAINSGFKAFVSFDKELIRLQQVTGQGAIGLRNLEKEITRLATTLGVSSESLMNVATTLAQAGLSAEDTRVALQALAKTDLAPSFDNIADTTEGAIAAMRQFGIAASDLEAVLGSVNAVAAAFAVESSDIITAIQRTGAVFASSSKGVSEGKDALNEFIAVFTSVRATTRESAETIATGLRTIFTRIQRGKTIDALREFGVELTDIEGKFVGPYEATKRLSAALNSLDPRDIRFSKIIEELGGFRQVGKVIPLIQQFAEAEKALAIAQRGQSSLSEAQAIAQKSLANQISKVREQFLALIRDIGKSSAFQSLFKIVMGLTSGLISLAGAFKPILPILGLMGAIKGVSALGQFGTGFVRGLSKNTAKGTGENIGSSFSGAKEKERGEATARIAQATNENTIALKALTSSISGLIQVLSNRDPSKPFKSGGRVLPFASGGLVPGTGNRDTVPAALTPGEFVIRKKAVESIGAKNLQNINKYAEGGVAKTPKETRSFGSGAFPFPKRISNAYFKEIDAALERERVDRVFGGGTFIEYPEEYRLRVDPAEAKTSFDTVPFDQSSFMESFKRRISTIDLYKKMSSFAKFIGLPQEDLSLVLPENIDFTKLGGLGPRGVFNKSAVGRKEVTGYDLSDYGYTKADEQDLYGLNKLIEEKRKQVKKIIKTPVQTFEDGSFRYDEAAARQVWDEVNDLEMKAIEIRKKKSVAEQAARAAIEETAKQTGRGAVNINTGGIGLVKNDTFYHELTHQLFQGLRTRSSETFDKYKARVVSLFEGDNDDLADAFDALESGYNSADVVYGRSYKVGLLNQVIENNRTTSGKMALTPTAAKEANEMWAKSLGIKKAKDFKPVNPDVNKALLDNSIKQDVIDVSEDNGKEEFLTTLIQNAPKLDANLQGVLDSTLNDLLGSGGITRQKFATGGLVPGSGNRDTVPALLTPGEFVIRKKAVESIGTGNLHKMNRYAGGGLVEDIMGGTNQLGAAILGYDENKDSDDKTNSLSKKDILSKLNNKSKSKFNDIALNNGNSLFNSIPNPISFNEKYRGLSGNLKTTFIQSIDNEIISAITRASSTIAASLGVSAPEIQPGEDQKQKFLSGINKATRGNLFEEILSNFANNSSSLLRNREDPDAPFDFPNGLPKGLFGGQFDALPSKWVDAKATFDRATRDGGLTGKANTQIVKELKDGLGTKYFGVTATVGDQIREDLVQILRTKGISLPDAKKRYGVSKAADLDALGAVNKGGIYKITETGYAKGGPVKLYHGSNTGTNDSVLNSFKEKGALSNISTGYGQGAGFYLYTEKDRAVDQAKIRVKGGGLGTVVSGDTSGRPMVLTFDEQLTPKDYDLDYEIQKGLVVQWIYDNYDILKDKYAPTENQIGLKDKFDKNMAAGIMSLGIGVQEGSQALKPGGSRQQSIYAGTEGDIREGALLGQLMSRIQSGDPALVNAFEEKLFEKPYGLTLKYVGASPLTPSSIDILSSEVESSSNSIDKSAAKAEKQYPKISLTSDGQTINAGYLKNDNMQGYVVANKARDYLYTVGLSKATGGGGPRLYDAVMEAASEKGAMLTSDRNSVSGDAKKVWEYYFKNRGDVKKTPLKPDDWTRNQAMIDPKLYGKEETWPPATDPAWVLQSGYSKSPSLINDESKVKRVDQKMGAGAMALQYFQRKANGGSIRRFAKGGTAEDTVPALLTPGEFVINKKAAKKIGYNKLHKLNKADKLQGFNRGGLVGGIQRFAVGGDVNEEALLEYKSRKAGMGRKQYERTVVGRVADVSSGLTRDYAGKREEFRANLIGKKEAFQALKTQRDTGGEFGIAKFNDAVTELAKELISINPTQTFEEAQKAAVELAESLAKSGEDITTSFKTVASSLPEIIETEKIKEYSRKQVGKEEGLGTEAINRVLDRNSKELEREQFIRSREGERFGKFAQFAPDLAKRISIGDEARGGTLAKSTDFFAGKGGRFSQLFAGAGGLTGIGGGAAVLADQLSKNLPTSMTKNPLMAGALGGLGGAGTGAASGSLLGMQLAGPVGAMIGGVGGAIIGGLKGFFEASQMKELENNLDKLSTSAGELNKSLDKLSENNSFDNLRKAEASLGTNITDTRSLADYSDSNLGLQGWLPTFLGGISKQVQEEALSTRYSSMSQQYQAAGTLGKNRLQKMDDAQFEAQARLAEKAKKTKTGSKEETELAKSSIITEEYTRSLLIAQGANLQASQSLEDYEKSLTSSQRATYNGITAEAQRQSALSAYIAQQKQFGKTDAQIQKDINDNKEKAIKVGTQLVAEQTKEIIRQEQLRRAMQQMQQVSETLLDVYKRVAAAMDRVAAETDNSIKKTEDYIATLSGEGEVVAPSRLNEQVLANPTAYSMDEIKAAAGDMSSLMGGGAEAQKMSNSIIASKVIEDQLPALLRESEGQDVGDIIGVLEDRLSELGIQTTGEGGADIQEALKEIEKQLASQGEGKTLADLAKSGELTGKLSETLKAGNDANLKVLKTWNDGLGKSAKQMDEFNKALARADDYLRKAADIRLNSEMELSKALGRNVTLTDMNKPFETQIKSLTRNVTPGGTTDPRMIARFIQDETQNAERLSNQQVNLQGPDLAGQQQALFDAQAKSKKSINDATAALKQLASDGSRASNALQKIQENQQLANNSVDGMRKILTSSGEELATTFQDLGSYTRLMSGSAGPAEMNSLEFRQQAYRGLDTISSLMPENMRGRVQAGMTRRMLEQTNPEVLNETAYINNNPETGKMEAVSVRDALAAAETGRSPENDRLIAEYEAAANAQIDANELLANFETAQAERRHKESIDILRAIEQAIRGAPENAREQAKKDAELARRSQEGKTKPEDKEAASGVSGPGNLKNLEEENGGRALRTATAVIAGGVAGGAALAGGVPLARKGVRAGSNYISDRSFERQLPKARYEFEGKTRNELRTRGGMSAVDIDAEARARGQAFEDRARSMRAQQTGRGGRRNRGASGTPPAAAGGVASSGGWWSMFGRRTGAATPTTAGAATPTTAGAATPTTASAATPTTASAATPTTAGAATPTTARGVTPKVPNAGGAKPKVPNAPKGGGVIPKLVAGGITVASLGYGLFSGGSAQNADDGTKEVSMELAEAIINIQSAVINIGSASMMGGNMPISMGTQPYAGITPISMTSLPLNQSSSIPLQTTALTDIPKAQTSSEIKATVEMANSLEQTGTKDTPKITEERSSAADWAQFGLGLLGLVPVFGEVADVLNAGIYAARAGMSNDPNVRNDLLIDSGASAISAIPVAGYAGNAFKYGKGAWNTVGKQAVGYGTSTVQSYATQGLADTARESLVDTDTVQQQEQVIQNPMGMSLGQNTIMPVGGVMPQAGLALAQAIIDVQSAVINIGNATTPDNQEQLLSLTPSSITPTNFEDVQLGMPDVEAEMLTSLGLDQATAPIIGEETTAPQSFADYIVSAIDNLGLTITNSLDLLNEYLKTMADGIPLISEAIMASKSSFLNESTDADPNTTEEFSYASVRKQLDEIKNRNSQNGINVPEAARVAPSGPGPEVDFGQEIVDAMEESRRTGGRAVRQYDLRDPAEEAKKKAQQSTEVSLLSAIEQMTDEQVRAMASALNLPNFPGSATQYADPSELRDAIKSSLDPLNKITAYATATGKNVTNPLELKKNLFSKEIDSKIEEALALAKNNGEGAVGVDLQEPKDCCERSLVVLEKILAVLENKAVTSSINGTQPSMLDELSNIGGVLLDPILNIGQNLGQLILDPLLSIGENIGNTTSELVNGMLGVTQDMVNQSGLETPVQSFFNTLGQTFSSLFGGITNLGSVVGVGVGASTNNMSMGYSNTSGRDPTRQSSPLTAGINSTAALVEMLHSNMYQLMQSLITEVRGGGITTNTNITGPSAAAGAGIGTALSLDERSRQSLDSFTNKIDAFGEHVSRLAQMSFPDKIEINGKYTFDVNIQGAAAFEAMGVSLKDEITAIFQPQLDTIWATTGGGLGLRPNQPALNKKR